MKVLNRHRPWEYQRINGKCDCLEDVKWAYIIFKEMKNIHDEVATKLKMPTTASGDTAISLLECGAKLLSLLVDQNKVEMLHVICDAESTKQVQTDAQGDLGKDDAMGDDGMPTVGDAVARQMRLDGISLANVSRRTGISTKQLTLIIENKADITKPVVRQLVPIFPSAGFLMLVYRERKFYEQYGAWRPPSLIERLGVVIRKKLGLRPPALT